MKSTTESKRHFLAYVHWNEILRWKALELRAGRVKAGQQRKLYAYGTAQPKVRNDVRKGHVLWIVTIPRFDEYPASPSLIARLDITEVIDQKIQSSRRRRIPKFIREMYKSGDPKKNWRYVVLGDKNSSDYYPVNYSYRSLRQLVFAGRVKRLPRKLERHLYGKMGQHFQALREIEAWSAESVLEPLANEIKSGRNVFVSYRRKEGAGTVREIVDGLSKRNINCWVDVSAMPRHIATGRKQIAKDRMKSAIRHAVRQSSLFLAVQGADYSKSEWTRLELATAGEERSGRRGKRTRPFSIKPWRLSDLRSRSNRQRLIEWVDRKLGRMRSPGR